MTVGYIENQSDCPYFHELRISLRLESLSMTHFNEDVSGTTLSASVTTFKGRAFL